MQYPLYPGPEQKSARRRGYLQRTVSCFHLFMPEREVNGLSFSRSGSDDKRDFLLDIGLIPNALNASKCIP